MGRSVQYTNLDYIQSYAVKYEEFFKETCLSKIVQCKCPPSLNFLKLIL